MKKYHIILLIIFIIAVIMSAISPSNEGNWWLEILPAIVALPLVFFLGKKFKLSHFSYTLILIYLILPIIQAHYGVAHVPIGEMLGEWFNSERNMFDRVTHFAFGFLLTYPLFEITKQSFSKNIFMHYFFPFLLIMGFSGVYEIAEWIVHESVSAQLSYLFVAAQQDLFDPARDMFMALVGYIVVMIGVAIRMYSFKK